ncbi:hypothetical protein HNQ35_000046 [Cerasibacillus quisquiliarum]|uniref:Uncharacterized protein n=1 Tax=Cerasibacillus quisquiliarum TaxID=227865 RepID=A0A511UYP6_9BACI|nr:hypothetical protein [Cerasibacillus quisquiliarum]MBB5144857.1 hypothetical protein [Cerasibacillus quisquiliarum]GEN30252.1 hypothetical protein CQU01_04900 [Cerasibacillus quisquiliarum]
MNIPIPEKKEISMKNVEWGSDEFNELIKQAKEQEQKQQEYDQAVEFVTRIMEGY